MSCEILAKISNQFNYLNTFTKMTFKVEMGKYLVQNLFYPAILGSFLFSIIQSVANKIRDDAATNFLSNSPTLLTLKILLAISILIFFCCDYLYSYVTKNYKPVYFVIDTFVILVLTTSFFAINIDTLREPPVNYLILPFIVFLIVFSIWDLSLTLNIKKDIKEPEKIRKRIFFCCLTKWQFGSLIFLGTFYLLYCFDKIGSIFLIIVYIITLLSSALFYFWRVDKKANLF